MSTSNYVNVQDVVNFLNGLLEVDSDAINKYARKMRVSTNEEMANHSTVQVGVEEDGTYTIGLVGIINGLFGIKGDGFGHICAIIDKNSDKIIEFANYEECLGIPETQKRVERESETKYEQERVGDYVQVYSGNAFYPLDPKAEDISVEDIAHSLSNLCRFTGHGERFYSVGEHSILSARMARELGFDTLTQLYCLGHDASESVMNDLARPVKQNVPQYKELEDKIMNVMWEAMGLPKPTKEHYDIVKLIDNTILYHEITQLMKRRDYEPPYETAPIYVHFHEDGGFKAGESKDVFLEMYYSLMEELKNGEND